MRRLRAARAADSSALCGGPEARITFASYSLPARIAALEALQLHPLYSSTKYTVRKYRSRIAAMNRVAGVSGAAPPKPTSDEDERVTASALVCLPARRFSATRALSSVLAGPLTLT